MISSTTKGKSVGSRLTLVVIAVALGLTIAAVSIPNLLRSRIASNEASAVGSVRTLNTALVTYSSEHPEQGYPQKLSDLSPYIDPVLASGQKSGYSFRYVPQGRDANGSVTSYRVEAMPVSTQAGQRRFSSSENGVIAYQTNSSDAERALETGAPQPSQPQPQQAQPARRMMRKGSMDLIVSEPYGVGEKIRAVAYRLGGYVDSERSSDQGGGVRETSIAVRVPVDRYEEARRELRGLGERIQNEQDDARDVTAQHVDLESNLRNNRVEEAQYLEIMRRAGTIKDTLAVSERLAEVRGRIEHVQGQLDLLAHQTEMSELDVTLREEIVVQPVDVRWHPVAEIKAAFADAAEDLSTYANFMIAVLFRLPVFALWTVTGLATFFAAWRLLRWMKRFVPGAAPAA